MIGFCSIIGNACLERTRSTCTTRRGRSRKLGSGRPASFAAGVVDLFGRGSRPSRLRGSVALFMSSDARKPKQKGKSGEDELKGEQLSDLDRVEIVQVFDPREQNAEALPCFVEDAIQIDGTEYLVMTPCLQPVVLARFVEDDEESALAPISDPVEIDRLFQDAFLALAEHELCLVRSAVVLTVDGDLSEFFDEDEDDLDDDLDEGDEADSEDELLEEALDKLDTKILARNRRIVDPEKAVDPLDNMDDELAVSEIEEEEVDVLVTFEDSQGCVYYICAPAEPIFLIGRRSGTEPARVTVADREEQDRVGPLIEREVQERLDRAANARGHIPS